MSLETLGWNSRFAEAFEPYRTQGLEAARVAREDRGRYVLLDASGEHTGKAAGKLLHDVSNRADLPAVGDWVAVRTTTDGPAVIVAVLPRTSMFSRKVADEVTVEQVVAANVDTVFLVSGLDLDLNPRRIERYLTLAWESGATPVILLNKSDLAEDLEAQIAEVEAVAMGVPVLALSAEQGTGLDALSPWLAPGRTVALLGSSGVGKSTLLNALLGEARQDTAPVREHDSRGRHTTTSRELVPLPGGALLLDTPGMRALKLWGSEENLQNTFQDVAALAEQCKFRDCKHEREPGCAVHAALQDGTLEEGRFNSWRKLQRELGYLATRQDARARAAKVAKWKAIHKSMKQHPKAKQWRR